jgi:hypothetical protein
MPMPDGSVLNWANYTANVGGERVKIKVKADGTSVQVPSEGDRVEVAVAVNLKQRVGDLLHPYVLELVATDLTVIATEDELAQERTARSVSARPGRAAKTG